MKELIIKKFIENALLEDMPYGDITSDHLLDSNHISKGRFIAKADGIIAGIDILKQVFKIVDKDLLITEFVNDGKLVKKGDIIAEISGSTRSILKGERLALNIIQRMSGIATLTHQFVAAVKPYSCKIVDTRKTTPNFRLFEKMAVKLGGGSNHRYNLSDAVMLKDNHIKAMGSISKAVSKIRENIPHTTKIEVEIEDLEMLKEALETKCDIIMLDNMSNDMMEKAVQLTNGQAILEASGNMSLEKVNSVAKTGVDIISVGALTHSYQSLDISLRFV